MYTPGVWHWRRHGISITPTHPDRSVRVAPGQNYHASVPRSPSPRVVEPRACLPAPDNSQLAHPSTPAENPPSPRFDPPFPFPCCCCCLKPLCRFTEQPLPPTDAAIGPARVSDVCYAVARAALLPPSRRRRRRRLRTCRFSRMVDRAGTVRYLELVFFPSLLLGYC